MFLLSVALMRRAFLHRTHSFRSSHVQGSVCEGCGSQISICFVFREMCYASATLNSYPRSNKNTDAASLEIK